VKHLASFACAVALVLSACSPSSGPQVGGQTNWLLACDSSDECGGLECVCGACNARCESALACAEFPDASCVAASDEGAIAHCGGQTPPSGLCLPSCEATCPEGTSCVAGICATADDPAVPVTIDATVRHQTLVGFGASLAYGENAIVAHPDKAALYNLLFEESGLDVLRLGNRYEDGSAEELPPPREIIAAASDRLGRRPLLFMTSGSPPAALKANANRFCAGNSETCTLVSLPGGGFDYEGFADHWRASLEAYAREGILPDYVSIQNNPNWLPPSDNPNEACHFLPEEGTQLVTIDGAQVEIRYPGYREALAAVQGAIADLAVVPRFGAPEANQLGAVNEYVSALDTSAFDALAIHFYYLDVAAVDDSTFMPVRELAAQIERPVFQTEMQADGMETAILIHHALTAAGASAYLQNDLVALTPQAAPISLVLLTANGFEPQGPYYALSQYAKNTDPGFIRVDATSGSTELLSSAWLSPEERALSVVLVNAGSEDLDAEIILPGELRLRFARSEVTRTVFDGSERAAALGDLPASGIVHIPSRSILTVALATE